MFVQQTWDVHRSWLHWSEFLQEEELKYSKRYHYRVCWSVPTRRKPIPQATASIYFVIEISKIKPAVSTQKWHVPILQGTRVQGVFPEAGRQEGSRETGQEPAALTRDADKAWLLPECHRTRGQQREAGPLLFMPSQNPFPDWPEACHLYNHMLQLKKKKEINCTE